VSNIKQLRPTDDGKDKLYQAYRDQEPEINELEKLADLAVYICDQETVENLQISERGSASIMVVQQLRDRIADFRKAYYKKYEPA
jgi:hypothetical protein